MVEDRLTVGERRGGVMPMMYWSSSPVSERWVIRSCRSDGGSVLVWGEFGVGGWLKLEAKVRMEGRVRTDLKQESENHPANIK